MGKEVGMAEQFDVLIIGAGVVGCAVAREMSRNQLKIGVLEKEMDVACGNSGIPAPLLSQY
jgi:glycerol-3-phosphate dehydrogenase